MHPETNHHPNAATAALYNQPRRPMLPFRLILSAELLLVHMVPFLPPIPATPDVTFNLAEYEGLRHADAEARLLKLRNALSAKHPKVRTQGGHGPAAEEIVLIAKQENADLIVIATHGETGFERVVFGSVTEKLVRTAGCPVLTIRPGGRQG